VHATCIDLLVCVSRHLLTHIGSYASPSTCVCIQRSKQKPWNMCSRRFLDVGGSTVVHVAAGMAGLIGTLMVGPRDGRFMRQPNGRLGK
jgi:ammonia channel protein AmtB